MTVCPSVYSHPHNSELSMARPRKPTALHALTGSLEHDPGRFAGRANEPVDDRALGPPPDRMEAAERVCWGEIERLAPWLSFADRLAVEVTAGLLARWRQCGVALMPPAMLTRLESMLGRLGLTPSDRSKVSARPVHPENRFSGNGRRPAG
jgi:hypothetical protein